MLIASVAARRDLARARVLARSFLGHQAGGRVAVLVVDGLGPGLRDDEPFEIVEPSQLPLERSEFRRMAGIYDAGELAAALRPWLLRHLVVDRGEPAVTCLDPDVEVLAPIDDLDDLARRHSLVVTPNRHRPLAPDRRTPLEGDLARAGAFGLGVVALSDGAVPFLEWWSHLSFRDGVFHRPEARFVDGPWVDQALTYFDHEVLRDPGINVAYWNLDGRSLGFAEGGGYQVDGVPLRLFHFAGLDPDRPHLLTPDQGLRPRVLLSEQPALRALCADHAQRLEAEGWRESHGLEYGFDRAANGMPIDRLMRRCLREEVLRREQATDARWGSVEELPDPFDHDGVADFVALLRSPAPEGPLRRIPRYLAAIYLDRGDLQYGFPDLTGAGGNHFLWWMREFGHRALAIPEELVPAETDLRHRDREQAPRREGVRVVGFLAAELGLGEAGRAMVAALDALGEPHSVLFETGVPQRQAHPDVAGRSRVDAALGEELDLNLVCINADPMPAVLDRLWPRFTDGRWTIGSWMWEVETFPFWMAAAADLVDEVWTSSAHSAAAISGAIDKPVHTFPLPVVPYPASALGRADFGLPDGFLFLFCFDFYSVAERKNPFGVIDAFRRAFAPGEGPHLVIKSINGPDKLPELERLRLHAEGRPDIHIRDGYLDPADQRALVACCDAYVSLHRAEGFGYTLAEAMLAGKPVIATGYSGNLEFMNERNSLLVEYTMTEVPGGCEPYPAGARWAHPDVDRAAQHMRRLVDDAALCRALGEQGRRDISERHSPEARVPLLAARLAASRAAAADPARRWRVGRARPRLVDALATPRVRRLVRRYLS